MASRVKRSQLMLESSTRQRSLQHQLMLNSQSREMQSSSTRQSSYLPTLSSTGQRSNSRGSRQQMDQEQKQPTSSTKKLTSVRSTQKLSSLSKSFLCLLQGIVHKGWCLFNCLESHHYYFINYLIDK